MLKKLIVTCFAMIIVLMPSISNARNDEVYDLSGEEWTKRKGTRFGYTYANKADVSDRLESPHMVSLGFEMQQTMHGGEWLDILYIQNIDIFIKNFCKYLLLQYKGKIIAITGSVGKTTIKENKYTKVNGLISDILCEMTGKCEITSHKKNPCGCGG